MVIGALRFNTDYLTNSPDGAWPDQVDHDFLLFHFDPAEIRTTLGSRWKVKSEAASDLDMPWEYADKDSTVYTVDVDLVFDDHFFDEHIPYVVQSASGSGEGKHRSTQKSLQALEAMALPAQIDYLKVYGIQWESTHTIKKSRYVNESYGSRVTRYDGQRTTWASLRESGSGVNTVSVEAAHKLETTRGAKAIRFTQKQIYSVLKREPVWHPPRPLRMQIASSREFDCIIRDMSIDVTGMSDSTGIVTSAVAHVRFAPFNGGPVAAVVDQTIADKTDETWKQWNTMISSGNYEKRRQNVYTRKKDAGKILFRNGS